MDNKNASSGQSATTKIRPTYAAEFRCIGSTCEDTCCKDWSIPVDRQTYRKYQMFPAARLGATVAQHVSVTAAGAPDGLYARINPLPSGFCPFLQPERLCGIQQEYGAEFLSATCSSYPRALTEVGGVLEGSLMLSCPEAARNVLLAPDFAHVQGNLASGEFRTDNFFRLAKNGGGSPHKPYGSFHEVRAWLIAMIRDRARPLWQRLLLIGSLCKRLDKITSPERDEVVPAILAEYGLILGNTWGDSEMNAMPTHAALKLKIILKLTGERTRDATCGRRFLDTYWDFTAGIGSPLTSTVQDDVQRFTIAEELYHRPFFERSPWILENYLVNYIFQNLFPFGREGSPRFAPRPIFEEYLLMTTQFAWINGLLIGVAALYRDQFAEQHVVKAIQSFSREVEHDPSSPATILAMMTSLTLNNLQGMALLLK